MRTERDTNLDEGRRGDGGDLLLGGGAGGEEGKSKSGEHRVKECGVSTLRSETRFKRERDKRKRGGS